MIPLVNPRLIGDRPPRTRAPSPRGVSSASEDARTYSALAVAGALAGRRCSSSQDVMTANPRLAEQSPFQGVGAAATNLSLRPLTTSVVAATIATKMRVRRSFQGGYRRSSERSVTAR